jgi:hypothetical protein
MVAERRLHFSAVKTFGSVEALMNRQPKEDTHEEPIGALVQAYFSLN